MVWLRTGKVQWRNHVDTLFYKRREISWPDGRILASQKRICEFCLRLIFKGSFRRCAVLGLKTRYADAGQQVAMTPTIVVGVPNNLYLSVRFFICFLINISAEMMALQRGAVGRGTALQDGRSRIRLPMKSLGCFIYLILLAALWPWGRLSL